MSLHFLLLLLTDPTIFLFLTFAVLCGVALYVRCAQKHAGSSSVNDEGSSGGGGGDIDGDVDLNEWSMDSVLLILVGVLICVVAIVLMMKSEGL